MATAWLLLLEATELVAGADDTLLRSLAQHLGAAEQARLSGIVRPRRRREFILGRLLLRHGVARVSTCAVERIEVSERAGAGPQVTVPASHGEPIQASLSHGGGWIACAIGVGFALGIDIEADDAGRDLRALAQTALSEQERRWVDAQGECANAFYQLWCGKESFYKYRCNAGLQAEARLPPLRCDDAGAPPSAAGAALILDDSTPGLHLAMCCPVDTELITEKIRMEDLMKRFTQSNKSSRIRVR
ncbi:4'-phosphopantetheinyl transferase superfamily protein [Herbaspirillum sp. YR522]|uniref:4'-phosphopantetheinyl transferase family protein n=1 Tax=Herbaspirillum sp. YR522 TaxID=1144342 RepID=UPI00026F5C22|nr:4'-phosphopantetheinyl transferase superfamily protein [Herbaspirillum sp. YR522]EJN09293.1 phosphopantetheinyl transferase [Herbaspirillum sp. YR522]